MIFNMVGGGEQEAMDLVYGFRISIYDSDPDTKVTYPQTIFDQTNSAYGKTPAWGVASGCLNDWEGCELTSGIHRQKGNATAGWTDIANSAAWQAGSGDNDMMTYVPTWYMKITNNGTYIDVAFSNTQIDDTWEDRAGSVGSDHIGHFRIGCFGAYYGTDGLVSVGGQVPTVDWPLEDFIEEAKARGTGYDIMTWYQWTYLTALAVLLYKSTNLQTALASGNVSGSAVQSETSLPFANVYGMYGEPGDTGSTQMAFFWIQNLWGNIRQWCGGAKTDAWYKLLCQTGYSSTNSWSFDVDTGQGPSSSTSGYLTYASGTTDSGFFPTAASASASGEYYADYVDVSASCFPYVGGCHTDEDKAGPFYASFSTDGTSGYMYNKIGTRLSYRL